MTYDSWKLDTPPRFDDSPVRECRTCGHEFGEDDGEECPCCEERYQQTRLRRDAAKTK